MAELDVGAYTMHGNDDPAQTIEPAVPVLSPPMGSTDSATESSAPQDEPLTPMKSTRRAPTSTSHRYRLSPPRSPTTHRPISNPGTRATVRGTMPKSPAAAPPPARGQRKTTASQASKSQMETLRTRSRATRSTSPSTSPSSPIPASPTHRGVSKSWHPRPSPMQVMRRQGRPRARSRPRARGSLHGSHVHKAKAKGATFEVDTCPPCAAQR